VGQPAGRLENIATAEGKGAEFVWLPNFNLPLIKKTISAFIT
jgi:hypothetical protein